MKGKEGGRGRSEGKRGKEEGGDRRQDTIKI